MQKKILFAVIAVVAGVVAADDMELMEAMESGDMKTAVALAKTTLANNPNDYDANLAMALHYEEQENYAEQAEHLKKCLKEDSDSPEAMNSLAMAYLNLGEIAKPDIAGVTSVEDSDDWPVLLCFKSGTKTVREVTVADLVETGIADFKKRVTQADKIVIRDGTVKWDRPTDKDPVLCTITDPKEITAFNKMFVFVEKAKKSDWEPSDIGQLCRCEGGPGIDWWKGGEKLAQTALHHGTSLWWDGFTWDFFLTPSSKDEVAKWFSAHSIDLKTEKGTNP